MIFSVFRLRDLIGSIIFSSARNKLFAWISDNSNQH